MIEKSEIANLIKAEPIKNNQNPITSENLSDQIINHVVNESETKSVVIKSEPSKESNIFLSPKFTNAKDKKSDIVKGEKNILFYL